MFHVERAPSHWDRTLPVNPTWDFDIMFILFSYEREIHLRFEAFFGVFPFFLVTAEYR